MKKATERFYTFVITDKDGHLIEIDSFRDVSEVRVRMHAEAKYGMYRVKRYINR